MFALDWAHGGITLEIQTDTPTIDAITLWRIFFNNSTVHADFGESNRNPPTFSIFLLDGRTLFSGLWHLWDGVADCLHIWHVLLRVRLR